MTKATFTDAVGREWEIAVSPYEQQCVLDALGCDIYDLVDQDKGREFIDKLETDDTFLRRLIWILILDSAQERGVSELDFTKAFKGAVIDQAYLAFIESLEFFFRRPAHRLAMRKLSEMIRKAGAQLAMKQSELLNQVDVDCEVEKLVNFAMNSQPEQASTLSHHTAEEPGGTLSAS